MSKVIRYERPSLEFEFDQQALTAQGCCRFVPVVVRLCGIPVQQHVMLTVSFERVRKQAKNGIDYDDDYEVHPASYFLAHTDIPGYREYKVDLLARPHHVETGTVRIKMESQAYNVLSEAVFCLDEERDALSGQYPASTVIRERLPLAKHIVSEQHGGITARSLFPYGI